MIKRSARSLLSAEVSSSDDALSWLTHTVRATLSGVDGVSISVLRRRRWVSVGTTDPLVRAADDLQYERGQGPVIAASHGVPIAQANDLSKALRRFASDPRAAGLGFRSLTSIPLASHGRLVGVLNLYSAQPRPLAVDVVDAAVSTANLAGDLVALTLDVDVVTQVMGDGDQVLVAS